MVVIPVPSGAKQWDKLYLERGRFGAVPFSVAAKTFAHLGSSDLALGHLGLRSDAE